VDKNFIYFSTDKMTSVKLPGTILRTTYSFFTTPGEFASGVTAEEKVPTRPRPEFRSDIGTEQQLRDDVRAWDTAGNNDNSRLLPAGTTMRVVRSFRLNHGGNPWMAEIELQDGTHLFARIDDLGFAGVFAPKSESSGPAVPQNAKTPTRVEQVKTVDPDVEFDRLIQQKERGEITPEQFNEKSKRLFGFRQNWMLRRSEFNLDEIAPKALASYKRDRAMGLPHEKAIEHSIGNWIMTTNLRREMAGQQSMTDVEIWMLKQRVEQMIASEGGGGSTGPQDWTIAHMMPEMEKTASALWRLHFAKAKHSPAYEKETAVIRENKKKPEASKQHEFKPAKWTHPNGHPRCLTCGGEEIIGGTCNKEPSAKDYAEFEKELDAEFPERVERRKKQAALLGDMFERGEITHSDFQRRLAMTDETERLLSAYWAGKITQTDLDQRLQRLRVST
jgi:hypothetical protein